eukprot:4159355-Alexandrium_andersonii.AAC.1
MTKAPAWRRDAPASRQPEADKAASTTRPSIRRAPEDEREAPARWAGEACAATRARASLGCG